MLKKKVFLKVANYFKKEQCLQVLLVLSLCITLCATLFGDKIPCGFYKSLVETLNAISISYFVAYGVYYLTVKYPEKQLQDKQAYIRIDLLRGIEDRITEMITKLEVDKDLSRDTICNTLENLKEDDWQYALDEGENICKDISKLFASGLKFKDSEFGILSDVYEAASSLIQFGYDSRKKDVVIDAVRRMYELYKKLDIICSEIDSDE